MKALVTGSGGLIGSACVNVLCESGWDVVGIDNDVRGSLFGAVGSTEHVTKSLISKYPSYRHHKIDIRDRQAVSDIFRTVRPRLSIHCAAQPSHEKATAIPFEDFDINAVGTLNIIAAAREFVRDSPFCFMSTNKVYGDRPNLIPLVEKDTRWDFATDYHGISEEMPIDQCLHSFFGVSKLSADILCQEYGRYYEMPVGIFRGGCLTGPQHASVELHGYLNYIVRCAVYGDSYTVFGHKAKQVRDQLHAADVAELFLHFYRNPRCGEVYNLGGGRENSISILETVAHLENLGYQLKWRYTDQPRKGDHICYISDLRKIRKHFPNWTIRYNLQAIINDIILHYERLSHSSRLISLF